MTVTTVERGELLPKRSYPVLVGLATVCIGRQGHASTTVAGQCCSRRFGNDPSLTTVLQTKKT